MNKKKYYRRLQICRVPQIYFCLFFFSFYTIRCTYIYLYCNKIISFGFYHAHSRAMHVISTRRKGGKRGFIIIASCDDTQQYVDIEYRRYSGEEKKRSESKNENDRNPIRINSAEVATASSVRV